MDELWALCEATRSFPGVEPLNVVEIGSWKGRSTIALALGVRGRGAGRVYAIDPHTGSKEHQEVLGRVDTFGDFLHNIKKAGVAEVVEPIQSTSHDASRRFKANSVHVLFIDGSHEYLDVLRDIEDWAPLLRDGAIVALNDPLYPGVNRALREVVLTRRSPYRYAAYVANTLFFRFHRDKQWRPSDWVRLIRLRVLLAVRFYAQLPASRMPSWAIHWGRRLYERLLP
jgi:predicted O-methyltransferase YrrM